MGRMFKLALAGYVVAVFVDGYRFSTEALREFEQR